jgi:hypothetical protein
VEISTAMVTPTLWMEIPKAAKVARSHDPFVGDDGLQVDLDTTVGVDASILDPKLARILSEVVAAMREVNQLWEILPTTLRVPGYSEKTVTQKDRVMHV